MAGNPAANNGNGAKANRLVFDLLKQEGERHGFDVVDLRSSNGTWINSQRITRGHLGPGDRLTVGRTSLVCRDGQLSLVAPPRTTLAAQEDATVGQVTMSLGVAAWQVPEDSAELLRRTDQALYHAKGQGRNQVAVAR